MPVRELFPNCPADAQRTIAEHACLECSGRVGRSAAAKAIDEEAVRPALAAHIRHVGTLYNALLAAGWDRREACRQIEAQDRSALDNWQRS